MPPPFGTGRFQFYIYNHQAGRVKAIPYRNAQYTQFLGDQGGSLNFSLDFNELGLSFANFYPGKHEIWVFDKLVTTYPIFAGPIVQMTLNSDYTCSVLCQDPLWYLSRRLLLAQTAYTGKPETAMSSLLAYTQGRRTLYTTASVDSASTQNINAMFANGDLPQISDLFSQLQNMGDGVDYYFRNDGTSFARKFHICGGKKKTPNLPLGLRYPGGALKGYSLQLMASGIANVVFEQGNGTGYVNYGSATDATNITAYDAQYEAAYSVDQNSSASLNANAATQLKSTKTTLQIPTITVSSEYYNPFADFDLGSMFNLVINDDMVQFSQQVRCIGFQATIDSNDGVVTNIYTNNNQEVT